METFLTIIIAILGIIWFISSNKEREKREYERKHPPLSDDEKLTYNRMRELDCLSNDDFDCLLGVPLKRLPFHSLNDYVDCENINLYIHNHLAPEKRRKCAVALILKREGLTPYRFIINTQGDDKALKEDILNTFYGQKFIVDYQRQLNFTNGLTEYMKDAGYTLTQKQIFSILTNHYDIYAKDFKDKSPDDLYQWLCEKRYYELCRISDYVFERDLGYKMPQLLNLDINDNGNRFLILKRIGIIQKVLEKKFILTKNCYSRRICQSI